MSSLSFNDSFHSRVCNTYCCCDFYLTDMVAVLLFDLYLLISSWLCLIPIPNRLYYLDLLIVILFVSGSGGFFEAAH